MKKLIFSFFIIGILFALAFGLFKRSNDKLDEQVLDRSEPGEQFESVEKAPVKTQIDKLKVPKEQLSQQNTKSVPHVDVLLPEKEKSLIDPEIPYASKIEKLYNRIKDVPINEELQRLRPFDKIFENEEKLFPYFYKGFLQDDLGKRFVRINLAFINFGSTLSDDACFFLGSSDRLEVQAIAGIDSMQILRSDDPGYLFVNISNNYFLQIFQTSSKSQRRYKSILTIRNPYKKFYLVLEGMDGTTTAGRVPTCYELNLPK